MLTRTDYPSNVNFTSQKIRKSLIRNRPKFCKSNVNAVWEMKLFFTLIQRIATVFCISYNRLIERNHRKTGIRWKWIIGEFYNFNYFLLTLDQAVFDCAMINDLQQNYPIRRQFFTIIFDDRNSFLLGNQFEQI